MLERRYGYLRARQEPAPAASAQLQREGFVVLPAVLGDSEVAALRGDLERVFAEHPPDVRRDIGPAELWEEFRYETLNRSAIAQSVAGHRAILDVVEPLLGEDCHVIANTTWRNPGGADVTHGGGKWHIDAGPHVPRPAGVPWDERIPYPVFAIACHVLVEPMPMESGPTGVIPRSHTSGQHPPLDQLDDVELTWEGQGVVPLPAEAGDVVLFVSDVWHRRLPTRVGDPGRFFLQIHYGRRDLAQRLRPSSDAHQLSDDAVARATTDRDRTLIGLHPPLFYDG